MYIETLVEPKPATFTPTIMGEPSAEVLTQLPSFFGRGDSLIEARFESPGAIRLRFSDGKQFSLVISALPVDADQFHWETAVATASGEQMVVQNVGDLGVPFETRTLRYLVDPTYAAKIDASLERLQYSDEELDGMAEGEAPERFFQRAPQDSSF